MALSQANLTVGVGIDTSKFIADAAIVKNELRGIKREVDAAAKAGDVGRLQAAAAQQDTLTKQYAALTREIRSTTAAHKEAVPIFNQMGGAFALLRSNTLLVAVAIAGAAGAFIKLADNAAKATDELEDAAAAIGITTNNLLAAQLAAARVGSSAEVVTKGMERVSRMMGEARKSADQLTQTQGDLRTGMNVLVTSGGEVLGTLDEMSDRFIKPVKNITDFTNAFTEMGIDLNTFPTTQAGIKAAMTELAKRLDALTDATQKARLAQSVFGREWPKQIELFKAGGEGFSEAEKFLRQYGLTVSDTERKQSEAWLSSFNTLTTVLGRITTLVGNTLGTALVPVFEKFAVWLAENKDSIVSWAQFVADAVSVVYKAFQWLGLGLTAYWEASKVAAQGVVDAWDVAFGWLGTKINTALEWFDWLIAKAKEAWAWLQPAGGTPTSTEVGGGGTVGGAAAGGYVRGPGTGTSDSIFARLSNGEYIINAASVRRLGTGFLHSLNSFAQGGLVGMPPIRFAEGGLVSASSTGGTPVHLHLGGQSFALSGSESVVSALVSEAHVQQMKSAGVKPSWFAGRSGGR